MPRFNHRGSKRDYLRGFGVQFWGSGCQPGASHFAGSLPGFGSSFKREIKRRYPATVALFPFGEVLPRPDIYDTLEGILKEARAEIYHLDRSRMDTPGSSIHEHGTCRMGNDPKRSALNQFCQMHDVKNLFVVDGSAFTTATEKNPTLTILALSWRATDYLADEAKKGNL